jgi:hypothetical protein
MLFAQRFRGLTDPRLRATRLWRDDLATPATGSRATTRSGLMAAKVAEIYEQAFAAGEGSHGRSTIEHGDGQPGDYASARMAVDLLQWSDDSYRARQVSGIPGTPRACCPPATAMAATTRATTRAGAC